MTRNLRNTLDAESLDDERLFAMMRNNEERLLSGQSWDKMTRPVKEQEFLIPPKSRANAPGESLETYDTVEFTNTGAGPHGANLDKYPYLRDNSSGSKLAKLREPEPQYLDNNIIPQLDISQTGKFLREISFEKLHRSPQA